MNTLLVLQNRAVKAAQEERWTDAQEFNQEIIKSDPQNISAINRLGFAYLQDDKHDLARQAYESVLELDKTNTVARKYLDMIDKSKKQPLRLPKALKHSDFIDEPGKTKSVFLVRLADPEILETLSVGAECHFKATKTRISVTCDDVYLGTLPDDICLKLLPLIEAGNTYSVKIQSLKQGVVRIFIRELTRASSVSHISSFPNENIGLLSMDHSDLAREDEEPVITTATGEEGDDQMLDTRDIDEALEDDDYHEDDAEIEDSADEDL